MVTFQTDDGNESFRLVDGLDEAVGLIEELRNGEGVGETHLYEVDEVPIQFHTYYRVEVGADAGADAGGDLDPADAPPGEPLAVTVVDSIQETQAVDMDQPMPPEPATEAVETTTFGIFSRP
jgi:hypothetical protein